MKREFGFIQIGNYFFNLNKIESINVDADRDITVFTKDRATVIHTYRGWPREEILTAIDMALYYANCETRNLDSFLGGNTIK